MIKAHELRLGNWVEGEETGYPSTEVRRFRVEISDLIRAEELYPIPLTPELLEAISGEKPKEMGENYEVVWELGSFAFEYHDGLLKILDTGYKRYRFDGARPTQYLHQLQNLYFALTGEELPINLQT